MSLIYARRNGAVFFPDGSTQDYSIDSEKVFALKIFDRIIHARYGLSRMARRSFSYALPII